MSEDQTISDIMLLWEEARQRGQPASAEELCRDCQDLLPEVQRRIAAFPEHYAWVRSEGLDYFRHRVSQAPRDSKQGLRLVQAHCTTVDAQHRAFEALAYHLDLLWVMIDTIHHAYLEPETHR